MNRKENSMLRNPMAQMGKFRIKKITFKKIVVIAKRMSFLRLLFALFAGPLDTILFRDLNIE